MEKRVWRWRCRGGGVEVEVWRWRCGAKGVTQKAYPPIHLYGSCTWRVHQLCEIAM